MEFIDEAKIQVRAGRGGDGLVHFRREKYVPKGGPDGGDGGHGANVVFIANTQLSTLQDFKYQQHYFAEDGENGGGSQKTGRSGQDLRVEVPVGTLVKQADSGVLLKDLSTPDEEFILAHGGRGGRGNYVFRSPTNQAPQHAEEGREGEELTVRLELKLLADVALVGFPNAGKSTLIRAVSAAKPTVAAYPFTTLTPHLGVVERGPANERKTFVVADVPGLIEGAHEGKGLGTRFLRHIERSRLLWFVLDASESPEAGRDLADAYRTLRKEIAAYDENLAKRPHFIVLNKLDLLEEDSSLQAFEKSLKSIPHFRISALAREGLDPLLWQTLSALENEKAKDSAREHV